MIIKPPKPGLGFGFWDLGFWDLVWLGLGVAKKIRANDGNNNGQLRIATPPRVAHAKLPGPKIERRANNGNSNGQLCIAMPPRVVQAKPPGPIVAKFSTYFVFCKMGPPKWITTSIFHFTKRFTLYIYNMLIDCLNF